MPPLPAFWLGLLVPNATVTRKLSIVRASATDSIRVTTFSISNCVLAAADSVLLMVRIGKAQNCNCYFSRTEFVKLIG